MKKSVVILIALIYAASIALVGFLGLKAKSYNEVIYVESIEILSDYAVDPKTGSKYIIFRPQNDEDKTLKLECRAVPDTASDKKIIYALPPQDCAKASIDENGLLTFLVKPTSPISVKVYIYSNQNTTISDEISIYYVP